MSPVCWSPRRCKFVNGTSNKLIIKGPLLNVKHRQRINSIYASYELLTCLSALGSAHQVTNSNYNVHNVIAFACYVKANVYSAAVKSNGP